MKNNHSAILGSVRSSSLGIRILTIIACSSCFLFAQDPQTEAAAADTTTEVSAEEAAVESTATTTPQTTAPVRINVADLVNAPASGAVQAAPVAQEVPAWVPPVVAAYLPVQDTNVAIGMPYRPGDPHFPYMVAGIRPPGGDPRLVPLEGPAPTVHIVKEPAVFYGPAEIGTKAVAVRGDGDVTQLLPPGAFVRSGVASVPVERFGTAEKGGRVPVYYRQATTTETGEDLIWNFPPGARLSRSAPAATVR